MVKSALVTGCSSGIGYETALEVASLWLDVPKVSAPLNAMVLCPLSVSFFISSDISDLCVRRDGNNMTKSTFDFTP